MSGSPNRKPFLIKVLALGLGLSAAWAAEPPVGPSPDPATAAGPLESQGRTLAPAAGDRGGAAVEIQELTAPDPNAAGILPPGKLPLGQGMWKSLTADELADRLSRLPAFERSTVMQSMTQTMLLSPSSGPKGGSGEGVAPWYVARLRALNARGDWKNTLALAEYGPDSHPDIAEAAFIARLASRPPQEICVALSALDTSHEGQFWSQLRIFCQFAAGDLAGAQLAMDVLREKGVSDLAFSAAAAKLIDGKAPANLPAPDNAIHAAMWQLAALPVTMQAAQSEDLAVAKLASMSGESDLVKLSGLGAYARRYGNDANGWPEDVARAQLSVDQKDDPEEAARKVPVAAGDAIFLQSIAARTVPAAKASAFAAMLQRGQSRGEFPYTAASLARAALSIPPLPETAWAAPEVTRVLIFNREVARAETWLKVLNAASPSDQPAINAIQIYGWVAGGPQNPARAASVDQALQWLVKTAASPGPNQALAKARMVREFPILAALGMVIPPDGLWAVDANSPGVALGIDGPALLDGMARAAGQKASGEVILNAALLLNGQGAAAARSQTTAAIVRALMKAGLRGEAKAMALEAMLGQGQRGL